MGLDITVCKDCKNYKDLVFVQMRYPMWTGSAQPDCLHDRCMSENAPKTDNHNSVEYKSYTDFVTGQEVQITDHRPIYLSKDSIGSDCRQINDGQCKYFEKKEKE